MNTTLERLESLLPPAKDQSATQSLRLRAFLVGTLLLIGTCILSVYADMVASVIQVGVMQVGPPAVAALLALVLVNQCTTRLWRKAWLSSADLVVIYAMQLVGVLVSTRGIVEKLVPPLAFLPYFATKENHYNELLTTHLPRWAVPFVPSANVEAPPRVIAQFWEGNGGGISSVPWSAWLGPLCAWFVLLGCVVWCFLCIAVLLRRQWMDHEQLRFPLATLPLAMIENRVEGQPFLANRAMWLGFAVAFGVFLMNGLHANFPDWPQLTLTFNFGPMFTERPWNYFGNFQAFLSLAAVGFAYFLPTDLLFSLWFFFLMTRMEDVGVVLAGYEPVGMGTSGPSFATHQGIGGALVLVASSFRLAWPYYKLAWKTAFGKPDDRPLDDSDELFSYRAAFLGLFASFAGIVVWLTLAGMSPLLAIGQMGIYLFLAAILMTRACSEAGTLGATVGFIPMNLINLFYPIPGLSPQNLTMLGLTNLTVAFDMRGTLLTVFMDVQKIGKQTGLSLRALGIALISAVTVSLVTATSFFLYLHYSKGGLSLYPFPKFNCMNNFNIVNAAMGSAPTGSLPHDGMAYSGFAFGILATLFLVFMRARFSWFPFHPLGLPIAATGALNVYWFPFFLAWMIKSATMRTGGVESYRKLAPFMLGLILGEFMAGTWWVVMNIWRGWSVPAMPWP